MQTPNLSLKKSMRRSIVFVLLLAAVQASAWSPGSVTSTAGSTRALASAKTDLSDEFYVSSAHGRDHTKTRPEHVLSTCKDFIGVSRLVVRTSNRHSIFHHPMTVELVRSECSRRSKDLVFENPSASKEVLHGIRSLRVGSDRKLFDQYVELEFIDGTKIWYKQPRFWRGAVRGSSWERGLCQVGGMFARITDGFLIPCGQVISEIFSGLFNDGTHRRARASRPTQIFPHNREYAATYLAPYPADLHIMADE